MKDVKSCTAARAFVLVKSKFFTSVGMKRLEKLHRRAHIA
jgi:hypothetical protein